MPELLRLLISCSTVRFMLRLFIKSDIVFLASTHLSSNLIDRFAQRFRNGELSPDFLLLHCCSFTAESISCGGIGMGKCECLLLASLVGKGD